MKQGLTQKVSLVAAGVIWLAGLVWTYATVQGLHQTRAQLERKQRDLQQLDALDQRFQDPRAVLALLERTPNTEPVDLQELLRSQFPGLRLEARWREERGAAEGWRTVVMEVQANRISAVDLSRLMIIAENQQPPWRLVECEVRAVEANPGTMEALLIFEGLHR